MARLAAALALLLALPAAAQTPPPPPAERIVTGLSQDAVSITTSFTGSEILIYGAIRRDAPQPPLPLPAAPQPSPPPSPPPILPPSPSPSPSPLGIIVAVEGPPQTVTVRRKDRVAGIWINTDAVRIGAAPDFYVVASSGRLALMLDPDEDVRYRISPPLAIRALAGDAEVEDTTPFTEALLRLRTLTGRYRLDEGSVRIVDDTLFRADVRMPSNLVEGEYRARIFLVRDGKVIDSDRAPIRVRKVGLERLLYQLAMERPFWYGLMSLAIAMAAGWIASAAFRALRRG